MSSLVSALSDEEKLVFKSKDTEEFSVAHLKEVIIRSRLHDKTLGECVKELVERKRTFKKAFEDTKDMGFLSRLERD